MSTYLLYECAIGYGLFEINQYEEISQNLKEFQDSISDYKKVSQLIKKINFYPFTTHEQALENTQSINNCIITKELKEFLLENFPKKKKSSNRLGSIDKNLSNKIKETLDINVVVGDFLIEVSRAIRTHAEKFLNIKDEDLTKAELGLAHAYSRANCMFDVNREDKPIIQSIALIDLLDKDINSFCMRIKEWFGWHFPELGRIIKDNYVYVRIVKLIEQRKKLSENQKELEPKLNDITLDNEVTKNIIDACSVSMGSDINEGDLLNIKYFTEKVESLIKYRENLANYLVEKMKKLAPNTSALVGEIVAARLISHAGSLATLSKYPASTIQILGAEKALFRALKTRSKTPKYGLLYHSSFIGKAKLKNKGKISRYLANKIAMCARIDYFSNERYNEYGNELKNQIEERLNYLDTGVKPRKNLDVMKKIEDKIKKKEIENKEEEKEKKEEKFLNKKKKKKESEKKKEDSSDEKESSESEKAKPVKKKKIKEESDDESSQSKSSVEIIKSKTNKNKKKK